MKWLIGIVLIVGALGIAAYLAFPSFANTQMQSKIDEKLRKAFGDRFSYSRIESNYDGKSAKIYDLKLLQPDPESKHNPLAVAAETDIVFDSLTAKHANATSLKLRNCQINAVVDSRGEASIARFIREKPLSGRTWEIKADDLVIENVTISTFVAPRERTLADGTQQKGGPVPDEPTSVLKVKGVHALNLILPPERSLLGREHWIAAEIANIELQPTKMKGVDAEPCIKIASVKFELAQAPTTDDPVRVRKLHLHQPELVTTHDAGDRKSEMRVAIMSVQKAFGVREPKEIHESNGGRPMPAGLILEDFHTTDARIESRGSGPDGQLAYFRLQNANVEGGNLAFGKRVTSPTNGFMTVKSGTESSSGTGSMDINFKDISGSYPKVTFHCDYRASNVPANAFTSGGAGNGDTKVRSGSLSLSFAGGANEGNLNITGSVTLSEDFTLDGGGPIQKSGLKLVRGEPISPVVITGTIEKPQIQMPSSLAILSNIFGNIVLAGPVLIVDSTVGQIPVVGEVLTTPVKETMKGFKKVGDFFQGK